MLSKKGVNFLNRSSVGMSGECEAFIIPSTISDCTTNSLMASYDDATLQPIPPTLCQGEREHVLIVQDETIFHTNEY